MLGRGVVRGEDTGTGERLRVGVDAVEQLDDAKIEQLDHTGGGHQQIVGLQIAVHDQMLVGKLHRLQRLQHQSHAFADRQCPCPREFGDRHALDQLQCKPRQAAGVDAAIEQGRDVRMLKPGQCLALAQEALDHSSGTGSRRCAGMQLLDRHLLRELAVHALRAPDATHAAAAELLDQLVGAQSLAGLVRGFRGVVVQGLRNIGRGRIGVETLQQGGQFRAEFRIGRAQLAQSISALRGCQFDALDKQHGGTRGVRGNGHAGTRRSAAKPDHPRLGNRANAIARERAPTDSPQSREEL